MRNYLELVDQALAKAGVPAYEKSPRVNEERPYDNTYPYNPTVFSRTSYTPFSFFEGGLHRNKKT
jgi:hypothetical protein